MRPKRLEEVVAMVNCVLICLLNSIHMLWHAHRALYEAEHKVGEKSYPGYTDNARI